MASFICISLLLIVLLHSLRLSNRSQLLLLMACLINIQKVIYWEKKCIIFIIIFRYNFIYLDICINLTVVYKKNSKCFAPNEYFCICFHIYLQKDPVGSYPFKVLTLLFLTWPNLNYNKHQKHIIIKKSLLW